MDIPKTWTFESPDIADKFDSHVRQQLPWYETVTSGIQQIAKHYVTDNGVVYDIGAATGNVGRAIQETLQSRRARLYAIESSEDMVKRYSGPGVVKHEDALEYEFRNFDFATSMLTLMFLPPTSAVLLVDRLMERCRPGGAIVFVERMLPPGGYASTITSRLTLQGKREAGAPDSEILDKELSLAGVQRPMHPDVFLNRGGVEWFRFGDFAGYLLEKECK